MEKMELQKSRSDVVGSLLRPAYLKDARTQFDEGNIDEDEFRRIEDQAVREAVLLQEQIGLEVVTDGEFRRLNFQDSFGASVAGFDSSRSDIRFYEKRVEGANPLQRWKIPDREATKGTAIAQRRPVVERLHLVENLPLKEYQFSGPITQRPVKVTLIGPDRICQRFDQKNSTSIYPTVDDFMADVVRIERQMVETLVKAGCRYIQIDAPGYTAYVDPPSLQAMRERGENPKENFERSLKADNEVLRGFDVTFGIHLCRGNQRSMWHREGTYDAIAERLFNTLDHHRFLLEYDTPRAGSFEPLRFIPKGKTVVLGLVSTKVPLLEKIDELKRRIDKASKYVPIDQLAISPQCGFASDVVGNLISEEDQKRKLEVVAETARQVWG